MRVKIENIRIAWTHLGIRLVDRFYYHLFRVTVQFDILKCDWFRIPPFASVRFGEAKNPGPLENIQDQFLRIAVTNPTAIYRKTPFLQALDCDVIALSETSATWEVQRREGIALRQSGFTNVWGGSSSPTNVIHLWRLTSRSFHWSFNSFKVSIETSQKTKNRLGTWW